MSGSFSGFSEADIRKLNSKHPEESIQLPAKGRPKLKPAKRTGGGNQANNSNCAQNTDDIRNKILKEKIRNSRTEPIPESAKLSKQPDVPNNNCDRPATANTHKPQTILSSTQYTDELRNQVKSLHGETVLPESKKSEAPAPHSDFTTKTNENEKEETALPEKKLDLEEFQARQKLMEEQNRKRKELLTKALAVKTKQTQEEAQKLNEIRSEFKKLDALLSNDVKILRQQIEVASLDYMEAQKRYYKVEKEFLDAKLALHQKLERKEMLTEHLCAIIEKNEERKADKLNELLLKLNLKTDIQEEVNSTNLDKSEDNAVENIDNSKVTITESTDNQNVAEDK